MIIKPNQPKRKNLQQASFEELKNKYGEQEALKLWDSLQLKNVFEERQKNENLVPNTIIENKI